MIFAFGASTRIWQAPASPLSLGSPTSLQLRGLLNRVHPIRRFSNDLKIWSLPKIRTQSPKWFKVLHCENFDNARPVSQWLNPSKSKEAGEFVGDGSNGFRKTHAGVH